jgi:hypothetical protein
MNLVNSINVISFIIIMSRHADVTADLRPTHTVEDYLMTMHVMERDYGEIVAARLAEMLGVAPATVAMTFRRMGATTGSPARGASQCT